MEYICHPNYGSPALERKNANGELRLPRVIVLVSQINKLNCQFVFFESITPKNFV